MLDNKVALLVGLAALTLAGCPDEEDGDTGAMTTPISDSADDDDGETENPTTDATEGSASMTTDPMTTTMSTSTTEPESTSGSECTAEDECITPADCPNPTTDQCIGCFCVAGEEESGGGDCSPGMCGGCGDCMMCQSCAQMMGGECEAEVVACNMNMACQATIQCANMCADAACQQQCLDDNPDGMADFVALISCLLQPGSGVCADACT